MRKLADLARGLGALVVLCAIVVGVPLALTMAVGWPLPNRIPSAEGVGDALTRRGIDDVVVVKTLAVLLWLAWTQIAIAFAIEMLAVIHGRAPRRAPTLPSIQLAVAKLVAAVTLIGSAFTASRPDLPVRPAMAVSASVSFEQVAVDPPPAAPRPPVEMAGPTYEVRRHDSLWVIAERTLGDGFRWREIRDLNVGRMMPDGDVISGATEDIRPGWLLVLPVGSTVESLPADRTTEQAEVVVVDRGDHLWSIAENEVAERLGREPTDGEVSDLWRRTIETNRDRLADPSNPSLIFAGQEILVPGDGAVDAAGSEGSPPEQRPTEPLPPEVPTEEERVPPTTTSTAPTTTSSLEASREQVDRAASEDESSDATSAPTGMFGVAGAALATGIGAALLRRRRRRLLHLPPGAAPPAPPPELDDVRAELLLAADEDLVVCVEQSMRDLASVLAQRDTAARPRVVQALGSRVEVLLSSPVAPGAEGWRVDAGGSVWITDGHREGALPDAHSSNPAVLVGVGAPEEAGQLYLDLEAEAVVSISGQGDAALDLARSIVAELAHGALGAHVDVIATGIVGAQSLDGMVNVRIEPTWDDVADDILARVERSSALLAANQWRNAFGARTRDAYRDDLVPLVVVLGEPPTGERFERISALVTSGRTTVSLVVLGEVPRSSRIEVDGERLHLPGLGLSCRAQALPAETLERVAEVLADADDLPQQLPLIEEVLVTPSSLATHAPDEEPAVLVRLLGGIDVVGGRRPLTPRQTAVVTYIALHSPAAGERIEDAIWTAPTASRRKRMANTVSDCRFALGEEHLPFAVEGRYAVGPAVGTDLDLFQRRVACANDLPAEEAIPLLRTAVGLIRGPVFTYPSVERTSYVWIDLENWMTTWELKATDTALHLSELAREVGDTETAVWAAEQGLKALSTHAGLVEALMKAYQSAGDASAAERVYERHVATLEKLGLDDVAETTIDLRERIRETA